MSNRGVFENSVKETYRKDGWEVLDSGWPDFLAVKMKDGKRIVQAVEAKSKTDAFRGKQLDVLFALSDHIQTLTVIEEKDGTAYTSDLQAMSASYEAWQDRQNKQQLEVACGANIQ